MPPLFTAARRKVKKWSKWPRTSSRDAPPDCSATPTSTRATCFLGKQTTSPQKRRSLECAVGKTIFDVFTLQHGEKSKLRDDRIMELDQKSKSQKVVEMAENELARCDTGMQCNNDIDASSVLLGRTNHFPSETALAQVHSRENHFRHFFF